MNDKLKLMPNTPLHPVWGRDCCGIPLVVSLRLELAPKLRLKIVNKHSFTP